MAEHSISPDSTRLRLTFGHLVGVIAIAAGSSIAWAKIPSTDDVQAIAARASAEATRSATSELLDVRARTETRLDAVEREAQATNAELRALNARMERLLTLVSLAVAQSADQSPQAIETARRVRAQIRRGEDPLALPPD